ncbi:MAG: hypothetical protein JWO06_2233, partial [Bacteroidota bacterium]|nr:hypothetical protein [Bacteroidota bacterium]
NIYAGNGLKKSENKYHPQQFKGKSEFLKYKSRG